jgi:tRNA nucleotidyltransferase/poly(A) polymerase
MPENHSLYAGRWVAKVRGRIVAQGGTPEEALRASQQARYKEKPEIVYMSHSFLLHPLIENIKNILPAGQELYLVGGAVRDMFLNRISPDLDFALPSSGISFARKTANELKADFLVLDEERDTARVIVTQEDGSRTFLDFSSYRSGGTLEADLRARDFTINAIAYDMHSDSILDPLDGAKDIRAKVIRACSPASISDDPVRILRAVRQAAGFGFQIDKSTRAQLKEGAVGLARISPERVRDEIFKILQGPKPDASMRALEMLGVLPHIMPELTAMKGVEQSPPHVFDVWTHTLSALASLEDILSSLRIGYNAEQTNDMLTGLLTLRLGRYREQFADHFSKALNADRSVRSLIFFATLYHDVCKPQTKTIDENGRIRFFNHDVKGAEVAAERGRSFNLSNDEIERLQAIIMNHMRIHFFATRLEGEKQTPSRKAIYRFFRDSGRTGIDLILLALADVRATQSTHLTQDTWIAYLDVARLLLENYWEHPEEVVAPPRLLDGNELMKELELKPGPLIGQLLEMIREDQAAGKIENKEQALVFAREQLAKGFNGEI